MSPLPKTRNAVDALKDVPLLPVLGFLVAVGIPIGIPLGFIFSQVDAVQYTAALSPLSSSVADAGWQLISYAPQSVVEHYAQPAWAVSRDPKAWPWRREALSFEVERFRLPFIEGGLWTLLGLFWVPGRRSYRPDIGLHAELAEILWWRLIRPAEVLARRCSDLDDREKTLGACRIAAISAYAFGYLADLVLLAPSSDFTRVVVALVLLSVLALPAFLPLIRGSRPSVTWGVLVLLLAIIGAGTQVNAGDVGAQARAFPIAATILAVVLAGGLTFRWAGRWIREDARRVLFHFGAFASVVTLAMWWFLLDLAIRRGFVLSDADVLIGLGLAFAPNVFALLALWRVLNAARALVQGRRLAIQVVEFAEFDWSAESARLGLSPTPRLRDGATRSGLWHLRGEDRWRSFSDVILRRRYVFGCDQQHRWPAGEGRGPFCPECGHEQVKRERRLQPGVAFA